MKEYIVFWKNNYNKILLLILIFMFYFAFYSSIKDIQQGYLRSPVNFYEEIYKKFSIYYPSIIGLVAVMHIGIEFNARTICLRVVHEDIIKIIRNKIMFDLTLCTIIQFIVFLGILIITNRLLISGIVAAFVMWVWCFCLILLGYILVLIFQVETVGLIMMVINFIIDNQLSYKYTLKNIYISYIFNIFNDAQYYHINLLIFVAIAAFLGILLYFVTKKIKLIFL